MWMYEDRKKALEMSDEEYKALTDREYADFTKIPVAARGHAGLIYHKKSKFDWEVRVCLGKVAYDYYQMDEPEGREYLRSALVEIEKRFPDLSPTHIFRRIDEQGTKAVQKWWMDIAKWVQTAAGKMRVTLEELDGHVEMLVGKKKNMKFDPSKLLGLKRAEVNYVLWGKSAAGLAKCTPLIEKEMDAWKVGKEGAIEEDGRVVGQHRIGVEWRIRREEFELQPESVKEHYTALSKGGVVLTPEQQKVAAESLISHLVSTCSRASTVANLHVLLFTSAVTTGDRIPVVMKEFGADPTNGPFLSDQELGGRVKSEYKGYASRIWKGDPAQLDVLEKSLDEDPSSTAQGRASKKATGGSSRKPAKSTEPNAKSGNKRPPEPVVPENPERLSNPSYTQWNPPASVRTEKQRVDYMGSFFGNTYRNNFRGQMKWNPISANNDLYVEPSRRSEDAQGNPLPLMNPQAMPSSLFKLWWEFLGDCAQGKIPEDSRFYWKTEITRLAMPPIPVPDDPNVHAAGELAKTKVPRKRTRGDSNKDQRKAKKRKGKEKSESTVDDDEDIEEDLADLQEEAERWGIPKEQEPATSRASRARRASQPSKGAPTSGHNESDGSEDSSGTEGSNFEPSTTAPPHRKGLETKSSSVQLNNRRIASEEPEDPEPAAAKISPLASAVSAASASRARQANAKGPPSPSNGPESSEGFVSSSLQLPSLGTPRQSEPTNIPSEPPRQFRPATDSSETPPRQSRPTTVPPLTPQKSLTPPKSSPKRIADVHSLPTLEQPYSEIRLGHPLFLPTEPTFSGSPAWLQLRTALTLWGSKIASLNVTDCHISLSSSARKPDLTLPPILTSAISIAQLFISLQKANPQTPKHPIVKISPTCGLDGLSPHHHLHKVVQSVLDVQAPLPTAKSMESNVPLRPDAMKAFFGILEKALRTFIDSLTKDQETLRHSEVEFLMMIRLALFLVVVLGAVATLRYMEVYVGGAAERWYIEEGPKRNHASQMWFYVWQLLKTGIPGLASALTEGRSDVFNYRGIDAIIPSTLKSVFDHALAQPPWWSAPGDGVPEPFMIGLKQWIPSAALFERLKHLEWSRLSFIDRVVVLLTVFTAALQLSAEPVDSARLKAAGEDSDGSLIERLETSCSYLMHVIKQTGGKEDGPKLAREPTDREAQREKELRGWLLVWESEKGPTVPFVPPVTGRSSNNLPGAIALPPAGDQASTVDPTMSQGSSIVPATPSEHHDDVEEAGEEPSAKLPTIAEEDDGEEGGLAADLAAGSPEQGPQGAEDSEDEVLLQTLAPKKRKVKSSAARVRSDAEEAGVKEAAPERRERPHRNAHLHNPYANSTPDIPRRQAEKKTEIARPSNSKRPRAVAAKAKAAAKADEPRGSPQKLSLKQKRAEAARKAAATKAANKAKAAGRAAGEE